MQWYVYQKNLLFFQFCHIKKNIFYIMRFSDSFFFFIRNIYFCFFFFIWYREITIMTLKIGWIIFLILFFDVHLHFLYLFFSFLHIFYDLKHSSTNHSSNFSIHSRHCTPVFFTFFSCTLLLFVLSLIFSTVGCNVNTHWASSNLFALHYIHFRFWLVIMILSFFLQYNSHTETIILFLQT